MNLPVGSVFFFLSPLLCLGSSDRSRSHNAVSRSSCFLALVQSAPQSIRNPSNIFGTIDPESAEYCRYHQLEAVLSHVSFKSDQTSRYNFLVVLESEESGKSVIPENRACEISFACLSPRLLQRRESKRPGHGGSTSKTRSLHLGDGGFVFCARSPPSGSLVGTKTCIFNTNNKQRALQSANDKATRARSLREVRCWAWLCAVSIQPKAATFRSE